MKLKNKPEFLKKYFWDIDFARLDLRSYPKFVLERILEHGDEKAVAWMRKTFTRDEIADVLFHLRGLSPKSANFWALMYHIDRKKVLCLQKHYLRTQRMHWPY